MTHFTVLRSKLTDAEILKSSLRSLGLNVQTNVEIRGSGCQRVRADVVVVLDGDHDLGWSRNMDGSFNLIADLWGVARKHHLARLINSVNQTYAVNQTLVAAKSRGLEHATVKLIVAA